MRHCLMIVLSLFVAACALPGAAFAGASEWALSEGGRMRMAALPPDADGKVEAVLQIEPKDGWKTYWRDPGASGMAPELDFSASTNLAHVRTDFPVPAAFGEGRERFIGYKHKISLPILFHQPVAGQPSQLVAHVLVGLCDKICIPFMADFTIDLKPGDQPGPDAFGAVKLAAALMPEKAGDDFNAGDAEFDPTGQFLTFSMLAPGNDMPEVFFAPTPGVVFGHPKIEAAAGRKFRVTVEVMRGLDPVKMRSMSILLLAKSGNRAIETTLAPK